MGWCYLLCGRGQERDKKNPVVSSTHTHGGPHSVNAGVCLIWPMLSVIVPACKTQLHHHLPAALLLIWMQDPFYFRLLRSAANRSACFCVRRAIYVCVEGRSPTFSGVWASDVCRDALWVVQSLGFSGYYSCCGWEAGSVWQFYGDMQCNRSELLKLSVNDVVKSLAGCQVELKPAIKPRSYRTAFPHDDRIYIHFYLHHTLR